MARYIDADKEISHLQARCVNCIDYGTCTHCYIDETIETLKEAPTANVVPRSEVERWRRNLEAVLEEIPETKRELAREIFEEIEKIAMHGTTPFGLCLMSIGVASFAELKKKYTKGE